MRRLKCEKETIILTNEDDGFYDVYTFNQTCRNGYEALQRSIRMMEAAGVTEELKACDPMRWVGLMNTLKAQAEEIIQDELIYK